MKRRDVQLTTEAHRPAYNGFYDALREAENLEGWRASEALRHFIECGFLAVRGKLLAGAEWDRNEEEYLRIERTFQQTQKTKTAIAHMLACMVMALDAEPIDFIGPVFAELAAEQGWGQFFTPFHLSYMMAKMMLYDAPAMLASSPRGFISLQEPACGVGGMALAANVVLREHRIHVGRQAHWHMTDVDGRAARAAFLQMSFTGASAIVVQGNTLSLETRMICATPEALFYPKRFERQPPKIGVDERLPEKPDVVMPTKQMELF